MKGEFASWDRCINMPEVQALKRLNNSPLLIKIKEMIHNKKENEVNIVFEYCEKNLLQEIQDRQRRNENFKEQEVKGIMYQAIAGVHYMHQNGFMHRDLKPENYLMNNNTGNGGMVSPGSIIQQSENIHYVKLADFGLAKESRNGYGNHTEYVSTRWYRAPELVLRSKSYT